MTDSQVPATAAQAHDADQQAIGARAEREQALEAGEALFSMAELIQVLAYLVECHDAPPTDDRAGNELRRAHLAGAWADARAALEGGSDV